MNHYTIPNHNKITSDNSLQVLHDYLINDKADAFDADFDEEKQKEYFEAAYLLFMMRCDTMHNTNVPIDEEEEKELRFMLDALIHARQAIYTHEFGE